MYREETCASPSPHELRCRVNSADLVAQPIATVLSALVSRVRGWSWDSAIVFGLCLSVASTVVLLRALEDRGRLDSMVRCALERRTRARAVS